MTQLVKVTHRGLKRGDTIYGYGPNSQGGSTYVMNYKVYKVGLNGTVHAGSDIDKITGTISRLNAEYYLVNSVN